MLSSCQATVEGAACTRLDVIAVDPAVLVPVRESSRRAWYLAAVYSTGW
jgi:hypothetical protein